LINISLYLTEPAGLNRPSGSVNKIMESLMKIYRSLIIVILLCALTASCGKKDKQQPDDQIGDEIEASLKDFENRTKYSSFTAETLKSIPDDKLEMAIVDYITDVKLKGYDKEEYRIIKSLSKGMQHFYVTWSLDSEVNNGGFIQYFYNSSGMFARDLIEALHNIKAYKTEKIAADAIDVYNKERALHDRIKKDDSLESFMSSYGESELGRLDELFINPARI
jgi:hypothetical protein